MTKKPSKIYWNSFTDIIDGKERCLGVAIVEGDSAQEAIRRCWKIGINPGGQVLSIGVSLDDERAILEINKYGLDRLIPPEELLAGGARRLKDLRDD